MMTLNNQMILILFEYIIKKHETLTTIPPIHVYNNRINSTLVFKIKDGYKLELQTPESMNLFRSTKKLIDKTKNGEKGPSLEVVEGVEVVLLQCNLVDNQYQQKSQVLYTFTPNKSYAYSLNAEFNEIIITFTDQNGRPLEIEHKVNLILLNNQ